MLSVELYGIPVKTETDIVILCRKDGTGVAEAAVDGGSYLVSGNTIVAVTPLRAALLKLWTCVKQDMVAHWREYAQ